MLYYNRIVAVFALVVLAPSGSIRIMTAAERPENDSAYRAAIRERAEKIADTLGIADKQKADRVRDIIAAQYRGLRDIHSERDARLEEVKRSSGADTTIADAWTRTARDQASLKTNDLHRRFLARLRTELSADQVEKVKDGLTYNVVNVTYERYLMLLPTLPDDQKREIMANLLEAREYAMDAGSSEEKHAIFGKYKGRINNYLSSEGYDLKAAEQELAGRENGVK